MWKEGIERIHGREIIWNVRYERRESKRKGLNGGRIRTLWVSDDDCFEHPEEACFQEGKWKKHPWEDYDMEAVVQKLITKYNRPKNKSM